MSRGDKSDQHKRQAGAMAKGREQDGLGRPEAEGRAWAAANKLHDGGKKITARRKLPSGPLGGSGRKTNRARSS